MKSKLTFSLALVLGGGLAGCSTPSHSSLPNYEAERQYWRELPYPRVEKLMSKYDGNKADKIWIRLDDHQNTEVSTNDFKEDTFSVVIDFCRMTDGRPSIEEIYKREVTPEGKITRKVRISALGQLECEEEYLDGKLHGGWHSWYANGKIRCVQNYANNQREGVGWDFSPTGKVLQKLIYRHGKLMAAWGFDVSGGWVKCVKNGMGSIMDYGEDGQPCGYWHIYDGDEDGGGH